MAADEEGQAQHMVSGFDDPQVPCTCFCFCFCSSLSRVLRASISLHEAGTAVGEAHHRLEEAAVCPVVSGSGGAERMAVTGP